MSEKNPQLSKEEIECRQRIKLIQGSNLNSKRKDIVINEIKSQYKQFKKSFKITNI